MQHQFVYLLLLSGLVACSNPQSKDQKNQVTSGDSIVYLQNKNCKLGIDLYGGAFIDFQLSACNINPFTWKLNKEQMPANNQGGAVFQGHFLCLGRWGKPSAGEMEAGIPHNGEPANTWWNSSLASDYQLSMNNLAPLDGLSIERSVHLHQVHPVFKVREKVSNELSIGRIYNIVQHATIGPPFLDEALFVFSNAGAGFLQVNAWPNPQDRDYSWPIADNDSLSQPIDLQATRNINYVSTHVFADSEQIGWVAAYSPTHQLLLGYVWPLSDYPWLNIWNHFENDRPVAKGLEFGTTGIGADYEKLLTTDRRFYGHQSFEYIDAGETKEKVFYGFMITVPKRINSIQSILLENGKLEIFEENNQQLTSFDINMIL